MAYNKPGVEIRQVQRSQSPILNTPDLEAVVVGNAYWWQEPTWDNPSDTQRHSIYDSTITDDGVDVDIALSGINSTYYDVAGDEALTVVDILGITGPQTGILQHLVYGTDFSVSLNVLTISGITVSGDNSTYNVKVGFRAKKTDGDGWNIMSNQTDIKNTLGEIVSWNPLAFGAAICINNAASRINVLGVTYATSPGTLALDAVNTTLPLKEIYAIAPVTHNITGVGLKTHCVAQSAPTLKKERISFYNKEITWGGDPETITTAERATLAEGIRDANSAIGSKRLFSIHPDLGFVLETRHISTVKPSWINNSFDYFTTIDLSTYGPYCKFVADTLIDGILYKAGSEITEAKWTVLKDAGWGGTTGMITVFAPVPGFYYNAQAAGQTIGTGPSQPITNVGGTGLAQVYGSQDLFAETELNTMAEGGTWIMTQDSSFGPIYSRHQMSTDITSIAKRELSVVKQLDYTAKFCRKGLVPYIGKYNITPSFLKLVTTILVGIGLYLTRNGIVNDMKVISVYQDDISKDTVMADVEILPAYPVNYIKVTLAF